MILDCRKIEPSMICVSTFSLTGRLNFGVVLPNHVVLPDTVNTFKSKLDKFWQHRHIISINQSKFIFQAIRNNYNIINVTALERLPEKHYAH